MGNNSKYDNYKQVKGLMFWAKLAFLNEKGMEILPTIENLMSFKEKVKDIMSLIHNIEEELYAKGISNES